LFDGVTPSTAALCLVVAYVIGSVPIGLLIARAFGIGDIRRRGSGTIGATNVLRTAGWLPAVLTLVGDVVKGMAAVCVSAWIVAKTPEEVSFVAIAAVAGNCWSVFLKFRGGKGVATGLGALLVLVPWAILPSALVFLVVVATTRYVSLGSLLGALGVPIVALVLGYPLPSAAVAFVIALIIGKRHNENIKRLLSGTENRLGQRASAS